MQRMQAADPSEVAQVVGVYGPPQCPSHARRVYRAHGVRRIGDWTISMMPEARRV